MQSVKSSLIESGILVKKERFKSETQTSNEYEITTDFLGVYITGKKLVVGLEDGGGVPKTTPSPGSQKGTPGGGSKMTPEVLTSDEVLTSTSDSNESGQLTLTTEETKTSKKKPLPYYPEYANFVDQWVKAYPTVGIQMPRDGSKIKQLIEKTRDQLKIRGMPFTEEAVCAFWGLFLTRLKDTWYNGKDLPIIESKYTAIIFELENGKQGQKFTSKATEAADYIASLRKGVAH
jgi:hypothetical protein